MWVNQTKRVLIKEAKIKKSEFGDLQLAVTVHAEIGPDDRAYLGIDEEQFARGGAKVQWTEGLGEFDVVLSGAVGVPIMGSKIPFDKPRLVVKLAGSDEDAPKKGKKAKSKKWWNEDPSQEPLPGVEPPPPPKFDTHLEFEMSFRLIGDCRDRLWMIVDSLGTVLDLEVSVPRYELGAEWNLQ